EAEQNAAQEAFESLATERMVTGADLIGGEPEGDRLGGEPETAPPPTPPSGTEAGLRGGGRGREQVVPPAAIARPAGQSPFVPDRKLAPRSSDTATARTSALGPSTTSCTVSKPSQPPCLRGSSARAARAGRAQGEPGRAAHRGVGDSG